MFSDVEMNLAYKLGNANINIFPYPHFYLENLFPSDYYLKIQENLPNPEEMLPIEQVRNLKGYKERFALQLHGEQLELLPENKKIFWKQLQHYLVGKTNFANLVFSKFQPFIAERFKKQDNLEFNAETLLIQDTTNYALGPHTDASRKVVTLIFYLPSDTSQSHLGTSIYLPNDPDFRCQGGAHHKREHFSLMHTNPFLPNTLFAFFKTDDSFHGVEKVFDPNTRRWLLLFDIYYRQKAPSAKKVKTESVNTSKVKFLF